jgi:uncharacterized protein (DUF2249 family)
LPSNPKRDLIVESLARIVDRGVLHIDARLNPRGLMRSVGETLLSRHQKVLAALEEGLASVAGDHPDVGFDGLVGFLKSQLLTQVRAEGRAFIAGDRRHVRLRDLFDALAPGESMALVDDHDSRLLCSKVENERGGARLTWDYLERGPEVWRVRISRL